jgi:hypothetical protein
MVNVSCDDNVVNCVISCIYTYAWILLGSMKELLFDVCGSKSV